jgi:hypothetical protein
VTKQSFFFEESHFDQDDERIHSFFDGWNEKSRIALPVYNAFIETPQSGEIQLTASVPKKITS